MIPSLTLLNVLETTPDLTLNQLLQYLEAQFSKKYATDRCNSQKSILQYTEELRMDLL